MSPLTRRDVGVASGTGLVAVGGLAAVPALATTDPTAQAPGFDSVAWWVCVALVIAQAALLLGVRRWPRAVLVAVAVAAPVGALAGADDAASLLTVAVVVATFVVVLRGSLAELWPALAVTTALVATAGAISGVATDLPAGQAVALAVAQAIATLGLTVLVAVFVATRREAQRARQDRLQALEREQQALVQAALARERTAMARELHDIAAHHLSGIAVMAAAIGTQVETDPAGARAAAQDVRQQSTAVLRDLRRLVGLLREDGPGDETRPETLAGIAELARDAAGDVTLTVLTGSAPQGQGVGPLAQLAAYRMAQEALANAARHAPGAPVTVEVDERSEDAVRITVTNGPSRTGGSQDPAGFGLLGMRERADLTGSMLEAGPTPDGGWQVALRIPRDPTDQQEDR